MAKQVKMNYSGTFKGAVSNHLYRFKEGVPFPLEDAGDVKHLSEKDYSVVNGAAEKSTDSGSVDLTSMKKAELLEVAKERQVEIPEGATKEEILGILQK